MLKLENIKKIYFLGIGGIGMSALARYFKTKGISVSGYDKTETTLTVQLVAEGIPVHYEDNVDLVPKDADVIIYTPAVPKDHKEYIFLTENNYPIYKRAEVLGLITQDTFTIAVAGTHGKTTTTAMIAHILKQSGKDVFSFVGGITKN
jgi:UDP-N-acetylmuramate--alanine ligase